MVSSLNCREADDRELRQLVERLTETLSELDAQHLHLPGIYVSMAIDLLSCELAVK